MIDRKAQARFSSRAAPYVKQRSASDVDAVVLHQMGFSRGNDPSRYDAVTAHYKILPDGTIIESHPWTTNLPAANGLNRRSVSVEFAGNLPKRHRSTNPSDFWSPEKMGMNQLTQPAINSGRKLLAWLYGRGIRFLFGHIQSAPDRGIDPGPDIWSEVAEWALRSYGFNAGMHDRGRSFTVGSGKPIPASWIRAQA